MSSINGHANTPASNQRQQELEDQSRLTDVFPGPTNDQFQQEKIRELVAELEVPFDPSLIEWRVINTAKGDGGRRGQVVPYADSRAYTDRLNALFTPAGWTRKYAVHSSANFQRTSDEKTVAKVFVTCDLTIFGIGSHAATGEEWADSDNAGTTAEAQAFKRAAACFGLGRYLYHFSGIWVDLDERKRPLSRPALVGWATPKGWREGLRPKFNDGQNYQPSCDTRKEPHASEDGVHRQKRKELVKQVESLAEALGKGLYRGLLKDLARVWGPSEIGDDASLQKVLVYMHAADRGLRRLEAALERVGREPLVEMLRSMGLNSLHQVRDLQSLHQIVVALEAKAERQL